MINSSMPAYLTSPCNNLVEFEDKHMLFLPSWIGQGGIGRNTTQVPTILL